MDVSTLRAAATKCIPCNTAVELCARDLSLGDSGGNFMSESSKSHASSPLSYIQTNRLVLRPPHLEDAPDVLVIHGNPETNRHNPAGPMKDLVEAKERITEWIRDWDNHGIGYWCVTKLDGAQVIGVSGVR